MAIDLSQEAVDARQLERWHASGNAIGNNSIFTPGQPISPIGGLGIQPHRYDYPIAYNITTKPRDHQRFSFEQLRQMINIYDIAQICINHRIEAIRSYDWELIVDKSIDDEFLIDALTAKATGRIKNIDRTTSDNNFNHWLAKFLFDVLAYDAGCLFRLRNRFGEVVGLKPIDGTTIVPLLDEFGNQPGYNESTGYYEPAYFQSIKGTVFNWLTKTDIIYMPMRPQNNSLYGTPPIESVLANALLDVNFQQYFQENFTESNIPKGFVLTDFDFDPEKLSQAQALWNSKTLGNKNVKQQLMWMPQGADVKFSETEKFESTFSDWLMRKTAAAFHVTPTELGFTDKANKATADSQRQVQKKTGDIPLCAYVAEILSGYLRNDCNLPVDFRFKTEVETSDNLSLARADEIYLNTGVVSAEEIAFLRFGTKKEAMEKSAKKKFTQDEFINLFVEFFKDMKTEIFAAILENKNVLDIKPAFLENYLKKYKEFARDFYKEFLANKKIKKDKIDDLEQLAVEADNMAQYLRGFDEELKGFSLSFLKRIASFVANEFKKGKGAIEIARGLAKKYDKLAYENALRIARTELNKIDTLATVKNIKDFGYTKYNLETAANACPICLTIRDDGQAQGGYLVANGEFFTPIHPNCTCSIVPVIGSRNND